MSAKIRIRPLDGGLYLLTFPNGKTARILERSKHDWVVLNDDAPDHLCYTMEFAVRMAYAEALDAPPPVPLSADELATLAAAAEQNTVTCGKILRDLLKRRTGRSWSVRRARGTAASWIHIGPPPARGGALSAEDFALLHRVFRGNVAGDGVSLRPCRGSRTWAVYTAAGHALPRGFEVASPAWD